MKVTCNSYSKCANATRYKACFYSDGSRCEWYAYNQNGEEYNNGKDWLQSVEADHETLCATRNRIVKVGRRGKGCRLSAHETRLLLVYNLPNTAEDSHGC